VAAGTGGAERRGRPTGGKRAWASLTLGAVTEPVTAATSPRRRSQAAPGLARGKRTRNDLSIVPLDGKYDIFLSTCQKIHSYYRHHSDNLLSMDTLDKKIITELAADARRPLAEVARNVGMSTAAVHQRVKRLRQDGIITGYRVLLDWEAVGLPIGGVVSVQDRDSIGFDRLAERLSSLPYVETCAAVTGEFDLLLLVHARSSTHLGEILNEIRQLAPGPSRTVVMLASYFSSRIPPLPE